MSTSGRARLRSVGVALVKEYSQNVPGGCEWKLHFTYPSSLMGREEAKTYVRVFLLEEYGVDEIAFFVNPKMQNGTFYAVFFTDWR